MLHIAHYALQIICEAALETRKLSVGELMYPLEVDKRVPRSQRQFPSDRWWVTGTVHPQMWDALEHQQTRHIGKVITTLQGTRYIVLAQQGGAWQHRFLLQVAGQQMREFLRAAVGGGMDMCLGLWGQDRSCLFENYQYGRDLVMQCLNAPEPQADPQVLRREACYLATTLFAPDAVSVEELPPVENVCVTIVPSRDLVDAVLGT